MRLMNRKRKPTDAQGRESRGAEAQRGIGSGLGSCIPISFLLFFISPLRLATSAPLRYPLGNALKINLRS
jgi:hypothetical protein